MFIHSHQKQRLTQEHYVIFPDLKYQNEREKTLKILLLKL
jgi:hypothetical protein